MHYVPPQFWSHPFPSLFPSFSLFFPLTSVTFIWFSRLFFALSRKDILSIQFENFFTSQCNWLILLMRLLFSICSHTLEILRFGYVTAKFSTLGWFWSAYGSHCLHFFLNLASLLVFLGFLSPHELFFLFATSKILSFFSLQGLFFFSDFKMQFCTICFRSRHTSYFHKLYWGARETNLFLIFLLALCKPWMHTGRENSPYAISLVPPCHIAADWLLSCSHTNFCAGRGTQPPTCWIKVWAQPPQSLWFLQHIITSV